MVRIDPDQNGIGPALIGLQSGGKLKGMHRHNPVIMIGSYDQRSRIVQTHFNIMKRGIFVQKRKLAGGIATAEF